MFMSQTGILNNNTMWLAAWKNDFVVAWQWHHTWKLPRTKVLGKLACLVLSEKIGIWTAERNWKQVKKIKHGDCANLGNKVTAKITNHPKQHYVPYYISIVFFLSLKYAFGIISMFFTLVMCSIILARLFLTLLHPCFLPHVQIYSISVRLLMSLEKCPIWQVLYIIKFGTFAFFFVLYHILFKFIMFYFKCPKCHTPVFSFLSNTSCINRLKKSLLSSFSFFFLTVPIP